MKLFKLAIILSFATLFGCTSTQNSFDYSAFRAADPHSILVLPPINNTPEVVAPYSVMAQAIKPIAESGYYVFPVAVVDQTFKNNGLTVANDVHSVSVEKLHEIFGADAALYLTISDYGTSYVLIASETRVTVNASLVDLRSGVVLWKNSATASSDEDREGENNHGLLGALVDAAVNQIFETISDTGFKIAGKTTNRLLSAGNWNGLLYGPRSPNYGQPTNGK